MISTGQATSRTWCTITTKVTLEDVWLGRETSKQKIKFLWNTLKKGDAVRIKLRLKTFAKGDELRYSKDEYVTLYRQGNRWKLKNLRTGEEEKNLYKEDQLKKVDTIVNIDTNLSTEPSEQQLIGEKEKEKERERESTPPPETDNGPPESRLPSYDNTPPPVGEKRHLKADIQRKVNKKIRKLAREGLGEVEEDPDHPGQVRIVQHRALKTKAQLREEEEREATPIEKKQKRLVKRLKSARPNSNKRRIKKKKRIQ